MNLAAVFDLDGTLLDTIEDLSDNVNAALEYYKLPALEVSDYKKIVGKGAYNLCETSLAASILKKNTIESGVDIQNKQLISNDLATFDEKKTLNCTNIIPSALDVLLKFKSLYEKTLSNKTKPYDGIIQSLNLLICEGVKLSVISNKPDTFTKDLIAMHFPKIEFHYIIGDGDKFPRKPNPASLKYIMNELNVLEENTYYFGDSGSDMKTAIAAGAIPVGVLWGFRDKEELLRDGAKILLKSPDEIKNVFDK